MESRTAGRAAAALVAALALSAGAGPAAAGSFTVLTYNVAGLPEGVSGSNPSVNTPLISPRLNAYDLAVVQEDFVYHADLISQAEHPYRSEPDPTQESLGDGLNRFSRSPFSGHTRIQWDSCFGQFDNGSDCLTPKGFSLARHELAPGAFLDVYDWHADAGSDPGSQAARQDNLRQLGAYIVEHSAGNAVLVMGDSNSRYAREFDRVPELVATAGLTDVWVELVRGGDVPELDEDVRSGCDADPAGFGCERIDKILYRSGGGVALTALDYQVPDADFRREDGEPLSDHLPVAALFEFQAVPEPGTAWLIGLGLVAIAGSRTASRVRPPAA